MRVNAKQRKNSNRALYSMNCTPRSDVRVKSTADNAEENEEEKSTTSTISITTMSSMTVLAFGFPALAGLLFGYDIGATSGAVISLTSSSLSGATWAGDAIDTTRAAFFVSSSLVGALSGSGGALVFGNVLGRRRELQLAACLYAAGALTVSAGAAYVPVVLGRLMYGIGIGFAMHAAPIYIGTRAYMYTYMCMRKLLQRIGDEEEIGNRELEAVMMRMMRIKYERRACIRDNDARSSEYIHTHVQTR